MKSFQFLTDENRGGVILCNLDTLEEAVQYLHQRFTGIVKVEQGLHSWTLEKGFFDSPSAPQKPSS